VDSACMSLVTTEFITLLITNQIAKF